MRYRRRASAPVQHTATHYNDLNSSATHCNTCARGRINMRYWWRASVPVPAPHCNILQHTATHCTDLNRCATHCNALQYLLKRAHKHEVKAESIGTSARNDVIRIHYVTAALRHFHRLRCCSVWYSELR